MVCKIFYRLVLGVFLGSIFPFIVLGQGSEDAGFCSVGSLRSLNITQSDSFKQRILGAGLGFGMGEKNIIIAIPTIEWNQSFSSKFAVQGKLSYQYSSGKLGKVTGISDAFLSVMPTIYRPKQTDSTQSNILITGTIGVRAPLGRTDFETETIDSASLMPITYPMAYQPGLGSLDLILGTTFQVKKWHFALAAQLPVYHVNRNNFMYSSDTVKVVEKYFESRQLIRKPDVMLRADRRFHLGEKLQLSTGLIALYHLGNDTSLDSTGKRFEHLNSKGLTANINLGMVWLAGSHFRIEAQAGAPILARKSRPDGLTRNGIITVLFQYSF